MTVPPPAPLTVRQRAEAIRALMSRDWNAERRVEVYKHALAILDALDALQPVVAWNPDLGWIAHRSVPDPAPRPNTPDTT